MRREVGRTSSEMFGLWVMHDDKLDTILLLIRRMESTANGLQQLRGCMGTRIGEDMLDVLIQEAQAGLVEIKRKLAQ